MVHLFPAVLIIALTSVFAGAVGSLLGLGGGVVVIPILTLGFQLPFELAVGASLVSVIATSSGSAATYVRDRLTNLRVGMFLELATTTGAITGAFLASVLVGNALYLIFGVVLLYSLYPMTRRLLVERRIRKDSANGKQTPAPAVAVKLDPMATALALDGSFYDPASKQTISYHLHRIPLGFVIMYVAGIVSGLLGLGGGIFKVLAMDTGMGMPIKTSSATSNFMMGATAAASAGIYFLRGDINPVIAGPVALGVLVGSLIGTRLLARLAGDRVRLIFVIVLSLVALQMLARGFGFGIHL